MSRYEKLAVLLTAIFIAVCIGVYAFGGREQSYTVTVDRNGALPQSEVQQGADRPDSLMPGEKINLNTAPEEELARLPGIGEVRAADIVAYRKEHGLFEAPEDLMQVKGIGTGTFEGLKDYITIE